ncbi:metallophosphoesterase family protein [Slackia piriformis]
MGQIARTANSMSRRGFVKIAIAGVGAAYLAGNASKAWASEEKLPNQVKFAVMSDLHYFSPSLWSDCADYTTAENSDRKMFKESAAILDAALASIVSSKPDIVFIPGDLTKDSEMVCHEEMRAKIAAAREQLRAAGVDAKFFVINGNHDVNNSNGLDFSSGAAVQTQLADPARFREIWADCGYGEDSILYAPDSTSAGSLSYVARPAEGITLIAVDSCKYSADQTDSGIDEHETSGIIGQDLLNWITAKASEARANGDVVIVMQHHGVVPHFDDEPTLLGEYLVDNYEAVAPAYADAGVSIVLTGHMHANDISAYTSAAGNTLHDVETDSLATYPSYIRTGALSWSKADEVINAEFAVDVAALGAVSYGDYADRITGAADIADITVYGKDRTLTQSVVDTIAKDFVAGYMTQIVQTGGIKQTVAGLLGVSADELGAQAFGMVSGMLPTTFETGMQVALSSFNFSIWFDADAGRVKIDQYTETADEAMVLATPLAIDMASELEAETASAYSLEASTYSMESGNISFYIDATSLTAFLDSACSNIDTAILANPASAMPVVSTLVNSVLDYAVDGQSHTVLGLVDYAYQTHLMGNEACEAWAEDAIAKVAGGEGNAEGLLIEVLRAAGNTAQADLTALLETVPLDVTLLVTKGNSHFMTTLAYNVLKSMLKDGGDLVGLIADENSLGNLIPDVPALSGFAYSALYTLSHDSNEENDHAFVRSVYAKEAQPDNGGNGSGGSDGTDGEDSGSENNGDGSTSGGNGSGSNGSSPTDSNTNGTNGNGSPSASNAQQSSAKSSAKNMPKTGDETAAVMLGVAAVAGAGAVAAGTALHKMNKDI